AGEQSNADGRHRSRSEGGVLNAPALGLKNLAAAVGVAALLASCALQPTAPVAELAPSGRLRAAINFGNPILAAKDPATGEPRGVSVDLARELGKRLG